MMSDPSLHPHDELQELLDSRLSNGRRTVVEAHLVSCESCRRELSKLRSAQQVLRALPAEPSDPEFEVRVRAALDVMDGEFGERRRPRLRQARSWRWLFATLAAAATGAVLVFWALGERSYAALPGAAIGEFRAVRAGHVRLLHEGVQPTELEQRLVRDGLHFRPRVLDLSMMGWELRGGLPSELNAREAGLFVYRDAAGRIVVCEMFQGRPPDLPPGAERFEHDGIPFFAYRERGVTAVFWPEGDLLCVLVSDLPAEELRALAIAKAMRSRG
jgi:anti-sigma factor RsiW